MINRQGTGRKMKRNHSNALPKFVIAYDTETYREQCDISGRSFSHRFRLGVAIVYRLTKGVVETEGTYRLHSPGEFWSLVHSLSSPQYTVWIVAHNALFDMIVSEIADQFERAQLVIDWPRSKRKAEDNDESNCLTQALCIIESPPTIIAARSTISNGRLVIVDTLNWFPLPLSELGAAIGLPKLKMPPFTHSDDIWFEYCYRDAQIVGRSFVELMQWVRANDLGMFRYTGAAQAMAAYRHRFMPCAIYCHDNTEVKKLERQSYFGGRTEVFKMGSIGLTVHQLDVNSLFPSVMRKNTYPCLLNRSELRDSYDRPPENLNWAAAVAEVVVCSAKGVFPVRTDKGVTYPVGEYATTLAGKELELAYRCGLIVSVKSWAEYKLADLFTTWVDAMWGMRQTYKAAGNSTYDQFTKRLLNSLYGKFGQLSPKWVNVSDNIAALPWSSWTSTDTSTGERQNLRSFGWQVQLQAGRAEPENNFIAISSFVTAAARVRMNWLRFIAGESNVYYQGVDSLVVTDDGLGRLTAAGECSETELGKLRHQLTVNSGEILGCSDYVLGDKVVLSGRSLQTEETAAGELLQHRFSSAKYMFTGAPINEVMEDVTSWQRASNYHKGTVGTDGWVSPLRYSLSSDHKESCNGPQV